MKTNKEWGAGDMKNIDVELAEDIKTLIKVNPDVQISESLKDKINSFGNDDLVKVTKVFGSLKIVDAEVITEELLETDL